MEIDETSGEWYVLQAMSGKELKMLDEMINQRDSHLREGIDDGIVDVRVPVEKHEVFDKKKNKMVVHERKRYPGYVLAKLKLRDEDGYIRSDVVDFVKSFSGIIGFVGGVEPAVLSPQDVSEMLRIEEETATAAPAPLVEYKIGDEVRIKVGSFAGQEGQVESVDNERQRLKVSVNVFGRETPTEIGFSEVERVEAEAQTTA